MNDTIAADKYKKEIEYIKLQIIEKYNPEKIILFGSLARCKYGEGNDIDLLIIQDNVKDKLAVTNSYYKEIDYNIPADFIITTPEGFKNGIEDVSNVFARNIVEEGVVLYEK